MVINSPAVAYIADKQRAKPKKILPSLPRDSGVLLLRLQAPLTFNMPTEKEINECCHFVATQHLADEPNCQRSEGRVLAERAIVESALEGVDRGLKGMRLRFYVIRNCRQQCGFNITTWLAIFGLIANVIRIVQEWRKNRKALEV